MINSSGVAMLNHAHAPANVDWSTNKDEVGDKDGAQPEEKSSTFLPNIQPGYGISGETAGRGIVQIQDYDSEDDEDEMLEQIYL